MRRRRRVVCLALRHAHDGVPSTETIEPSTLALHDCSLDSAASSSTDYGQLNFVPSSAHPGEQITPYNCTSLSHGATARRPTLDLCLLPCVRRPCRFLSMPHLPDSRIRRERRRAITSGCPWDLVPLGPADKGSLVAQKGAAAAAWTAWMAWMAWVKSSSTSSNFSEQSSQLSR